MVLKEKLKTLKQALKVWNAESFGAIEGKIKSLESTTCVLYVKAENGSISDLELALRRKLFAELWQN